MLLMGSNFFGSRIVSQTNLFWQPISPMPSVEKIRSSVVVTFFSVDSTTSARDVIAVRLMTSDGRKMESGRLMRSSGRDKNKKLRLLIKLFFNCVLKPFREIYPVCLRKTQASVLAGGQRLRGGMIEKDRKK
jgi:hypothetical protein